MSGADDIREVLWNEEFADPEALLEQYKLYVEMADRISQRRGAANTFFLTFNTAVVGALAGFYDDVPREVSVSMYVAAAVLSIAWAVLLRSYRNLNTAKFKVIGVLEERLPANVYYKAEWKALGEGKDWRKYIPLSLIETFVPGVFLLIYLYLFWISWCP